MKSEKSNKKKREPQGLLYQREIASPPSEYQPRKEDMEDAVDMPGANRETVRSAFFRRFRIHREKPE